MKFLIVLSLSVVILVGNNYVQAGPQGWGSGGTEVEGFVDSGEVEITQNRNQRDVGDCSSITCEPPPVHATCSLVKDSDKTFPRPRGWKAACCPLYKCKNKDLSVFAFHGAFGKGPEIAGTNKCPAHCLSPPVEEDVTCTHVLDSDTTVSRPKGQRAKCCPLLKCEHTDGSYYVFHGVFGKGPMRISPCRGLVCKPHPTHVPCSIMELDDTTFGLALGKKAPCCPVYKCLDHKAGKAFPFHGVFGAGPTRRLLANGTVLRLTTVKKLEASEIKQKNKASKSKHHGTVIDITDESGNKEKSVVADGDAVANAAGDNMTDEEAAEAMKEMEATFNRNQHPNTKNNNHVTKMKVVDESGNTQVDVIAHGNADAKADAFDEAAALQEAEMAKEMAALDADMKANFNN